MGVEREAARWAKVVLDRSCHVVEQNLREQVEALNFQVQLGLNSSCVVQQLLLPVGGCVRALLPSALEFGRVGQEGLARLVVPAKNYWQKFVIFSLPSRMRTRTYCLHAFRIGYVRPL